MRLQRVRSEWARKTAEEFKEGEAREAHEDVEPHEDRTARGESAPRLWTRSERPSRTRSESLMLSWERKFSAWQPASIDTFPHAGCVATTRQQIEL
jgi:hypothetical protein